MAWVLGEGRLPAVLARAVDGRDMGGRSGVTCV